MGIIRHSIAYLSLGSNVGDRKYQLDKAQEELSKKVGSIETVSSIYENPPVGFEAEQDFLNLCLSIRTQLSPFELLEACKSIEFSMGRLEKSTNGHYQPRCIDIDIILFNDLILDAKELTLPHPHFRKRHFVLKPLNDIAFSKTDPETSLTIEQLLTNCTDQSDMKIWVQS